MNRELGKRLQEFFRFLVKRGTVTEKDIHSIIDAGEEEGVLNLDEHEMIDMELVPVKELDEQMGLGMYNSAITIQAWYWFLKHKS